MLWVIVQSLINGLFNGGIYALVAISLTIIFGVMKMVNFATGEYMTIGMYMALVGFQLTGWNTYLLIPFVIVTMIIIAYVSFKLCLKPILHRGETAFILVTVGLASLFQNTIHLIFGPGSQTVPSSIKSTSIALGSFTISLPRLIAFCGALLLVLIISLLMNKSMIGRAMRATSEDTEVARILGISTERIFTTSFVLGIVIAGIAGLLITPIFYATPTVGTPYTVIAFIVIVFGGLGDIRGAFIGGLMLGIVEALVSTLVSQELGPAGIFVLFIIVLYFKPKGIFGMSKERGARV